MNRRHFFEVMFLLGVLLGILACEGPDKHADMRPLFDVWDNQIEKQKLDKKNVLAVVDGIPIYAAELQLHMNASKETLTKQEALEELIEFQLLAHEAYRRKYGASSAVISEFKKVLALQFLETQGNLYTRESISLQRLKEVYEQQKKRFIHKTLRKVSHALVLTGKGHYGVEEAKKVAKTIYTATQNVSSVEDFVQQVRSITKGDANIKVEHLPAFEIGSKQFVSSFVDGTFAIAYPRKKVSPSVITQYGIHIIFVESEQEASNLGFAQAKETLKDEMIDKERAEYIASLINQIYADGDVFIYDALISSRQSNSKAEITQ